MGTCNPTAEGRSRIFYVGRREFVEIFASLIPSDQKPVVKHLVGLPADAYIGAINYDIYHGAFCIRVDSKEFSPVPDGELIPEIPVVIRTHQEVKFREFT